MKTYRFYTTNRNHDRYYSLWEYTGSDDNRWKCLKSSRPFDIMCTATLPSNITWTSAAGNTVDEFNAESLEEVLERVFVDIL